MRSWITIVGFCLLVETAIAIPKASELNLPALDSPVIDEAGVLSDTEERKINALLRQLHSSQKVQMAVFIAKSLRGYPIEDFSYAVFEKWQLGEKGKDQGLLLTLSPSERRMRLEVGYGLEGDIPDAYSRRILDYWITPYLRKGDYARGITAGILAVAERLEIDLGQRPVPASTGSPFSFFTLVFCLIVLFGLFYPLFISRFWASGSGHGRRNSWDSWGGGGWGGGGGFGGGGFGSGGFGGGGFGGGGGGFGGGGASSSW